MQHLTVDTPPGRWIVQRAREFMVGHPVVGVTPEDLLQAGIQRAPRMIDVTNGRPVLDAGQVLDVTNIIWATGFVRDYRWIKLPIFDSRRDPIHHRGVVQSELGLYFVGLPYQSSLLFWSWRASVDAKYVASRFSFEPKRLGLRASQRPVKVTDLLYLTYHGEI
jgi:putative flavoprotein involved in K+ transport